MRNNTHKGNKLPGNIIIITIVIVFVVIIGKNVCSRSSSNNSGGSNNQINGGQYALKFDEKFNKGLATVDDLGLSILIAVDCSGSMGEYPANDKTKLKYIQASESFTEIVSFFERYLNERKSKDKLKLKLGLMRFNSNVEVIFPVTEMNAEEFRKFKEKSSNPDFFSPSGYTAVGLTIEKGTELLMQSGTVFKSLIIITDGENTSGIEPETVLDAVYNNRNNASTKDFPVITSNVLVSFIAFDVDSSVFGGMNRLGARITSAGNKEELLSSLKNIFIADITKLEAK